MIYCETKSIQLEEDNESSSEEDNINVEDGTDEIFDAVDIITGGSSDSSVDVEYDAYYFDSNHVTTQPIRQHHMTSKTK